MKTNNDYLAEYVREKRPEIEESLGFTFWKMTAVLREALSGLTKSMNKVADQESKLFTDQCKANDTGD